MKLGAVPYLNALPLIHHLPERPRLASPAALDRLLKLGEIDLATAPISTLFENARFHLVPGIAIGTRGSVKSVRLVFKKPGMTLSDVGSIYLDMESKVSTLLLKTLIHFKYKRNLSEIRFVHPLPSPDVDAALLIGDKAMENNQTAFLDLGYEWTSWTGLPFVFAAWIGKTPSCAPELIKTLTACRDQALTNLPSILPTVKTLSPEEAERYFTKNICYQLDKEEIEGMKCFHAYGKELGFFHHDFRLDFYPQ